MDTMKLNDGNLIPSQGFGVFMIQPDGPTEEAVTKALQAGYRHIDTAAAYFNEEDVGRAVKKSGIPREEIYITSKMWLQDYGYETAKKAIDTSLRKLGMDYMDLYLLHQPYGDTAGAWKAMEEAVRAGKIRSIGISNHTVKLMEKLLPSMEIMPAVNQVECNPFFQQKELRHFMCQYGTRVEAWFPLGHGSQELLSDPRLKEIAERHGKSVVQVILRWHLQEGIIALPKASSMEHIKANLDIFDFMLGDDEMAQIRSMDTGKGTHDPEDMSNEQRLLGAFDVHAND